MLEKLNKFVEFCKRTMLYIIVPIAGLAGYIWFIVTQNYKLKDRVRQAEFDRDNAKIQNEQEKADEVANASRDDYTKLRDEYLKQHPGE